MNPMQARVRKSNWTELQDDAIKGMMFDFLERELRRVAGRGRVSVEELNLQVEGAQSDRAEFMEHFCSEMSKSGAWAGEEMCECLSKQLRLSIVVVNEEAGYVRRLGEGSCEMYVKFVNGNHYQYLDVKKACPSVKLDEDLLTLVQTQ